MMILIMIEITYIRAEGKYIYMEGLYQLKHAGRGVADV